MNRAKLVTQFKREFWESHASFLRAPLYLGLLLTFLLFLGLLTAEANRPKGLSPDHPDAQVFKPLMEGDIFTVHPEVMSIGLSAIYSVFVLVLVTVLLAYLLSALYTDRKDQSILFWKSLPVTESQNVLTKLGTALLAAPGVYALAAAATGLVYLFGLMAYGRLVWGVPLPGLGALAMAFTGSLFRLLLAWTLFALWALPVFTWLMLMSALARKAPALMAFGLPVAAVAIEFWVFGSGWIGSAAAAQVTSSWSVFAQIMTPGEPIASVWIQALASPALWAGLALGTLMVAACVWLRNERYEV